MGRPPKPTALKLLTGNPGRQALSKQEPDPIYLTNLEPPAWLSAAAKAVWAAEAPAAMRTHLLTEVDVQQFAMLCDALAGYRQATAHTDEQGAVKGRPLLRDDGTPVLDQAGRAVAAGEHINAWTLVQSMRFKQVMALCDRFGLNPQARTRIAINPQGDLFAVVSPASKYFE